MKNSEKYPGATEEQIKSLPPMVTFLGLHPLVWVLIVVFAIAIGRACDNVEALGCNFFDWYDERDDEHKDEPDNGPDSDQKHGKKSEDKHD
jgi:hypothetical protein